MEWGGQLEFLQKRAKLGKPTPAYDNWPDVYEDLEWAYDAWWWMHGRRRVDNGGVRLLGAEEILAYCQLMQLSDEDKYEAITFYWPAMDAAFMEWHDRYKPKISDTGGRKGVNQHPSINQPRKPATRRL